MNTARSSIYFSINHCEQKWKNLAPSNESQECSAVGKVQSNPFPELQKAKMKQDEQIGANLLINQKIVKLIYNLFLLKLP